MGMQQVGTNDDGTPIFDWVDEAADYTYVSPSYAQSSQEQPNTPAPNLEGGDLGQTEAQAQDDYYKSIGLDPATIKDMAPADKEAVDAMISGSNLGSDWGKVLNPLKNLFTKSDGTPDWKRIVAAGTSAAALSSLNKPNKTPSGYQGGIPTLQAIRSQIPGVYDPNRRAGSGGQRYFSDMAYVNPADAGAVSAAQQRIAQGASDIVAANKANPAQERRQDIVRTAPRGTGMMEAPAPATPAKGVAGIYSPQELQALMAQIPVKAAEGGIMEMAKGRYLRGDTDGMADKLNTSIDGTQPAKLSHGEFVIPADVVSHLGNGNSDAGAKKLYQMMDKIRMARTGTKKQGKEINPDHFMPGGIAGNGKVKGFAPGGSTGTNVGAAVNAGVTGTESNLSNWAGPFVTGMLGQAQALGAKPYEAYQGPLTAGASSVQQEAFQNAANLNVPTGNMGGFKPQAFGAEQAQQYMNPYLEAALKPQLEEQRRQAQINLQPSLSKLTQAGGFGGGRQAIMESEANRNLQAQQNQTIGQGYADAYNKAMQQFNTEQGLGLQAQNATNQYGLSAIQAQQAAGKEQRGIESEGIAADIAQFEQEKLDPYKKLQFQQSMLQGLPVQAQQYNVADQSTLQKLLGSISDAGGSPAVVKSLQDLGIIPK